MSCLPEPGHEVQAPGQVPLDVGHPHLAVTIEKPSAFDDGEGADVHRPVSLQVQERRVEGGQLLVNHGGPSGIEDVERLFA